VFERVEYELAFPNAIRDDQGPEFVWRDLVQSAYQRGIALDFS
jgi:hypothetical protein